MSTTAPAPAAQSDTTSTSARSYAAQSATSPLAPHTIRAPHPHRDRRRHRHPLLRRLPLRPAPGPRRMARCDATVYPRRSRPRDRRPRHHRRFRTSRKFKEGDLVAVGCMVDSCRIARNASAASSSTARSPDLHLQRPRQHTRRRHLRRLLRHIVVDQDFVLKVPAEARSRRHRAPALRRHHHLFAAASLESRPRPESRSRRSRRPRPHGRQIRPRSART